ncbi:MAG: cation transporter [Clostridia bacterium]|nr:cation transporter [Clostridia bacterium]
MDMEEKTRSRLIVRTSVTGIVTNVLLAGVKAAVGLLAHSIAVVLDAVNNLSDALSSVVTILGAKLAGKRPDKKHPLGYGRIEYLSAMIVSALVLYAGITSLVESVKKIISPEESDYSVLSLVLIGVAVAVKIVLGRYVTAQGKKAESASLIASGKDALFDAVLSSSVLVCAVIRLTTGLALEPYVGIVISGFIIKAGIEMMLETVNDILGKRTDPELSASIKKLIVEEPGVRGAYDLFISNYGPNKDYASVHIEVPDTVTATEIDRMTRNIQARVYRETGIVMAGVGVYSYNTGDDAAARAREDVRKIALRQEGVLQFHGFYMDEETKNMRFDVVLSFDAQGADVLDEIRREVLEAYPGYTVIIAPDLDLTD